MRVLLGFLQSPQEVRLVTTRDQVEKPTFKDIGLTKRESAEADTIQKAKELKSIALTAAEWAKRKNMGEAAIQHCRSYALEAERKMGQMLLAGKASGEVAGKGRPKNVTVGNIIPVQCVDLDLSRKESAEAQMLAGLPDDDFEKIKSKANEALAKAFVADTARRARFQSCWILNGRS